MKNPTDIKTYSDTYLYQKYSLYNNKAFILDEDAEYRNTIEEKLKEAGFELVVSRGDNPDFV